MPSLASLGCVRVRRLSVVFRALLASLRMASFWWAVEGGSRSSCVALLVLIHTRAAGVGDSARRCGVRSSPRFAVVVETLLSTSLRSRTPRRTTPPTRRHWAAAAWRTRTRRRRRAGRAITCSLSVDGGYTRSVTRRCARLARDAPRRRCLLFRRRFDLVLCRYSVFLYCDAAQVSVWTVAPKPRDRIRLAAPPSPVRERGMIEEGSTASEVRASQMEERAATRASI